MSETEPSFARDANMSAEALKARSEPMTKRIQADGTSDIESLRAVGVLYLDSARRLVELGSIWDRGETLPHFEVVREAIWEEILREIRVTMKAWDRLGWGRVREVSADNPSVFVHHVIAINWTQNVIAGLIDRIH